MSTEYELTLSDYLSIMRRRAPYLIGTFIVVLLIAIKVAFSIPPTYRSTGTILVESPLVSENMVPGAIKNDLDERIDIIRQRVMTRDYLLQIVKKYGLFKESVGSMSTTDLIRDMRDRVVVESINSNTSREGQPTFAFTISFEDQHPEVALQVANELVARFLQLNQRESMRARAESDLYEVERNIRGAKEELRILDAELSAANGRHGMTGAAIPSQTLHSTTGEGSSSQMLQTLKAEYTKLSAVYTESHPDVRALKRKIAALEQESRTSGSRTVPATNYSSAAYAIHVKVDAANAKLDSLMQQKKMLQDKIAQLDHSVEQTSTATQVQDVPVGDHNNVKRKDEEFRNQKMNAQIAQNLESENKSEKFSLLEPPILPDKPFKQNRLKILAMGFLLAIAFSGGATMALESTDKRIRGTEPLAHVLGYRPLVVIPYLSTQEEEVRRKQMRKRALIAAVITLIAVMVALHFMYMRLDILFIKILARMA